MTTEKTQSAAEQARAKFAEELRKAELQDTIAQMLESLGLPAPRFVHIHSLYGQVASLAYGDSYASYGSETLSWDVIKLLAEKLPGVPMTQVRDGCLSFQPRQYVESLPEEKKERWQSEMDVCPLLLKVEALHGPAMELEWVTDLPGVGLVEVSCKLPRLPQTIATYTARRKEYMGGFRYERASFSVNERLLRIDGADGEPIAEAQSPIIWASGGSEYPQRVTLFWVDIHSADKTRTLDIATALAAGA